MKTVKVMIKDSKERIERISCLSGLDELYPLESWNEDDVYEALDVLTENMPAFFASEKDGKIHGFDFEIIDDEDYSCEDNQETDSSKWTLKNWLIDSQINFFKNMFHYDESKLVEMRTDLENRELEDVMGCYDLFVGGIEDALFVYGQKQFYEKCLD